MAPHRLGVPPAGIPARDIVPPGHGAPRLLLPRGRCMPRGARDTMRHPVVEEPRVRRGRIGVREGVALVCGTVHVRPRDAPLSVASERERAPRPGGVPVPSVARDGEVRLVFEAVARGVVPRVCSVHERCIIGDQHVDVTLEALAHRRGVERALRIAHGRPVARGRREEAVGAVAGVAGYEDFVFVGDLSRGGRCRAREVEC
mmetsp:Transcript_45745/g.108641  ORF Transcript_45745/g.108641 Transcript_45745/m.108641 type:complete len:202 (-) Transcript_45745:766-1371(-)